MVQDIALWVSHDQLLYGSRDVLEAAFPHWASDAVTLMQETDGITNKLVKATNKTRDETVLIRTYGKGSDLLIDRVQEKENMAVLSKLKLCPPLYAQFRNGLVYGFTEGATLSLSQMCDPHISSLIARLLACWHRTVELPAGKPREPMLFRTLNKWLAVVPDVLPRSSKVAIENATFKSKQHLTAAVDELRTSLEALKSPCVFCHCDLLSANIIYNKDMDAVNFIDYEYGCYSYRGFDIANHFCEYAGFECQWELYPSQDFQKGWLKTYLDASSASPSTGEQVDALYLEVNKFALAAHLFWGIWALVQSTVSDLDFDYAAYAEQRFAEFSRRKEEFLAL